VKVVRGEFKAHRFAADIESRANRLEPYLAGSKRSAILDDGSTHRRR